MAKIINNDTTYERNCSIEEVNSERKYIEIQLSDKNNYDTVYDWNDNVHIQDQTRVYYIESVHSFSDENKTIGYIYSSVNNL